MAKMEWQKRAQLERMRDARRSTTRTRHELNCGREWTSEALTAWAFASDYSGSSKFMLSMKRLTEQLDWVPSPKQAAAILQIRDEQPARA